MYSKIKNLASDTLIYGLFTIVGRFLTFMLTPLYANYLVDDDQLNFVYFIYAIIPLVIILYSFGMESAFFRFYDKDKPETQKKAFSNSYLSIFMMSIFISLIFVLFSGSIAELMTYEPIESGGLLVALAAVIIMLDAWILIPYALLRMERRAMKFAMTKFILIIFQVGFNIIFVVFMKMNAEGVIYANLISSILGIVILMPDIWKSLELKIDKNLIKEMLRFGLPTVPASISAMILHVGDRPILQWLSDSPLALNIYQTNYRLAIPMLLFVTVFDYAWKPFYLSNYNDENSKKMFAKVLTYFTLISSFIFLSATLFMEYAVQIPFGGDRILIPEKFWAGLGIIPLIIGGYYFNGVYSNISAGFLIEKKTKFLPIAFGVGAVFNVIFNIIFIPIFSYWAAAWATLFAYFIGAAVLYYLSRRIYPIKYEWNKIAVIIILSVSILIFSNRFIDDLSIVTEIAIKIALIAIFYIALGLLKVITKDDLSGIIRLFKKH